MLMTEEQARSKWCPMVRQSTDSFPTYNRLEDGTVPESCLCVSSDCMAWRWFDHDHSERQEAVQGMNDILRDIQSITGTRRGYCGAFGKPEAA